MPDPVENVPLQVDAAQLLKFNRKYLSDSK